MVLIMGKTYKDMHKTDEDRENYRFAKKLREEAIEFKRKKKREKEAEFFDLMVKEGLA